MSIIEEAFLCVLFKKTFGANPCSYASFHLSAQTHHESPSFNPGKLNSGFELINHFLWLLKNLKNHLL